MSPEDRPAVLATVRRTVQLEFQTLAKTVEAAEARATQRHDENGANAYRAVLAWIAARQQEIA